MTLVLSPILSNEPATYFPETGPRLPAVAYPIPTGESADHIQLIRDEVIVPILEAADPAKELSGRWKEFRKLRDELVQARPEDGKLCVDDILRREDEIDSRLRAIFEGASGRLGKDFIKPILGGLHLRKITRETVLPEVKAWPEESLEKIGDRMVLNELCLACVLHHLATGTGDVDSAKCLAAWSYHYADYAYTETGFSGKNHVPEGRSESA